MKESGQPEVVTEEQSVFKSKDMLETVTGAEKLDDGPKDTLASMSGFVHARKEESESSFVRRLVQSGLIPEGIKGLDW